MIGDNITIKPTIDIKDGEVTMIVSFHPKVNDSAFDNLVPVKITGTPEEVETDFIQLLESRGVTDFVENVDSVSMFEKSAAEAAEKTKMNKEKKDKIDKIAKKGTDLLEKGEIKKAETQLKNIQKIEGHEKFKAYKDFRDALNKAKNPAVLPPEEEIPAEKEAELDLKDNTETDDDFSDEQELSEDFDFIPSSDDVKSGNLDSDVVARGSASRAIQYGVGLFAFEDEKQEIIQQERIDKLNQNGNREASEDF